MQPTLAPIQPKLAPPPQRQMVILREVVQAAILEVIHYVHFKEHTLSSLPKLHCLSLSPTILSYRYRTAIRRDYFIYEMTICSNDSFLRILSNTIYQIKKAHCNKF